MKNDISFKELKESGYRDRTISEEIRENLTERIKNKQTIFEGL